MPNIFHMIQYYHFYQTRIFLITITNITIYASLYLFERILIYNKISKYYFHLYWYFLLHPTIDTFIHIFTHKKIYIYTPRHIKRYTFQGSIERVVKHNQRITKTNTKTKTKAKTKKHRVLYLRETFEHFLSISIYINK